MATDTKTSLLLHFDGADESTTITDETGNYTFTCNGSAQLDTAQKKFGTASLLLGNTAYISNASGDLSKLPKGTSDLTIEFPIRLSGISGTYQCPYDTGYNNGAGFTCDFNSSTIIFYFNGAQVKSISWTPPSLNTWCHISVIRASGILYFYQDGVLIGTETYITSINQSTYIVIGAYSSTEYVNGWIDEFRISNTARWTSAFTPPTEAYSTYGLVSNSKTYVYTTPTYGDSATKLTDDTLGTATWNDGLWVGWHSSESNPYITIDLGANKILDYVKFFYLNNAGASGIYAPTSMKVYGSTDGVAFTELASFVKSTDWFDGGEGAMTNTWSENLDVAGEYRYVRFNFVNQTDWLFISELEVYDKIGGGSAPNAPTTPSPATGGTGDGEDQTLTCYVEDPNDFPMDVSFYNASGDVLIGTHSGVASGGTATILWEGLAPGTSYTWYAIADNGSATAQSANWTFTAGTDYWQCRIDDNSFRRYLAGKKVEQTTSTLKTFKVDTNFSGMPNVVCDDGDVITYEDDIVIYL